MLSYVVTLHAQVDSVYNIFNPADPIAYLMNPCVDSR